MRQIIVGLAVALACAAAHGAVIPTSRTITWEGKVGVEGGIPQRTTLCATTQCSALPAYGNDATDATTAINNAIASCPADQVVFLPAGTYRIASGKIRLKSRVTLRGAGVTQTKIHHYTSVFTTGDGMIELTGNAGTSGTGIAVTGGLAKDSTVITLASATAFNVGDYVLVDQLNDGTEVTNQGYSALPCDWCGRQSGARSLNQVSRVTAKNGNSLSIDPPLHMAYDASLAPEALRMGASSSFIRSAGIEDLQLEDKVSAPPNYGNVVLRAAHDCWIRNVWSPRNAQRSHVESSSTLRCEVRDSHFGPNSTGTGSQYGVAMYRHTTNLLVENNVMEGLSSPTIMNASSGAVIGYNYIASGLDDKTPATPGHHGAHIKMVLTEGNDGFKYLGDWTWGSSGYNTAFRNWFRAYEEHAPPNTPLTGSPWTVQLSKMNWHYNIVGNVLGHPAVTWPTYESAGSACNFNARIIFSLGYPYNNCSSYGDATVRATLLRHGNYDYATRSTKWCDDTGEPGCQGGDASHTLPASLYLPAKPAWWCEESPWPPFGSDATPMTSKIPARRRHEGLACTPATAAPGPEAPANLQVR